MSITAARLARILRESPLAELVDEISVSDIADGDVAQAWSELVSAYEVIVDAEFHEDAEE